MKRSTIIITALLSIIFTSLGQYRPDILGEGFEQRTIDLGVDYSGKVEATLVRTTPHIDSDRAILYLHGFNDYFFQREMAHRFNDSLYNFYALDLRKYGRSLSEDQTPFEVREMEEYFEEIDSAVVAMRREGIRTIILMSHSTGGLTSSLYAKRDEASPRIDGLILNSPFLDMNLGWILEELFLPVVAKIGNYYPNWIVVRDPTTAYFESLDRDHKGEWSYDTSMKFVSSPPTRAGWLRAIHNGHTQIQKGANIGIPILLMYSDKSIVSPIWIEEYQCSDAVLDVKDIKKYGDKLGSKVTHVEIKDGMHDLILSGEKAREKVYQSIFEWIESVF
ncbi:MAG: alpha/beta hydrolase [Rikenellaceae bacterium]